MSTTFASGNYFNGESTFSAQLNNVVSRSVAQASQPITLLQNQLGSLTGEQSEVQTLGSSFTAIQSALQSINSATAASSYSASVDATAVASASTSSGALAGTYSLNITSLGAQTNTISGGGSGATTVTDPTSQNISSASSFTLTVNGKQQKLLPTGNSLNALVQAINASSANVQATVVNVGGSASPDYRLSVQSTQYSPDSIQLNDGTNDLLTSLNTGSYVTYQVNGQPNTPINSTSRNLSISTGLSAQALTTGTANITVSQNSSNVTSAISSFVNAFNSASAELTKNRGQNGGALTGNSLILGLQNSLNSISAYSAGGGSTVNSLADIGLTFDSSGSLTFDSSTFDAAYSSSPTALNTFLGSETGGGFIGTAYSALTSLTDSTNGTITTAGNNIGSSITSLTSQISTKQAQVTQLQTNLTNQLAQADSAISSLQGQLSEITDLFTAQEQVSRNISG